MKSPMNGKGMPVEIEITIGEESESEDSEKESPESSDKPKGYKKGGRIDGCAIKGHTKGTVR
jgi:hypothetical protein